jgi:GxxExxY protein
MSRFEPIPPADEAIARKVIEAAIQVHRELGPGFLESIYRRAMEYELASLDVPLEVEREIVVMYKGMAIPGQRIDLLVAGRIIVELKCVDALAPIHMAQTISYLKTTGLRLALLINFKTPLLKDGIKRIVR